MIQRDLSAQSGGQRVERVIGPGDFHELCSSAGVAQRGVHVASILRLHDVITPAINQQRAWSLRRGVGDGRGVLVALEHLVRCAAEKSLQHVA